MPTTVNVTNGRPSVALHPNDDFVWVNPTGNQVELTNCGGFCTQSSYSVPAAGATPGEAAAKINSAPTGWSFTESPTDTWNPGGPTPGTPRIQNPGRFIANENERDVA